MNEKPVRYIVINLAHLVHIKAEPFSADNISSKKTEGKH
jgi:hypothetical protein